MRVEMLRARDAADASAIGRALPRRVKRLREIDGWLVWVDWRALDLPEAVELALQQHTEHGPYGRQPGNVASDRPIEPDCRLRVLYVARSAKQYDQRRQTFREQGTGTCGERLGRWVHVAQVRDVVRAT